MRWITIHCVLIFQVFLFAEGIFQEEELRAYLSHFNATRNNHVDPTAKAVARDYIIQLFVKHGLDTWTEQFPSNQENYPGLNVIGLLPGRYYGTSQDKLVIIASHYDTVSTTNGVDDNGSGMAALLHAIKNYTTTDEDVKCTQNHTLLFVAFDLEEVQDRGSCGNFSCGCARALCGSGYFVSNLTRYLNETGGSIQGAYVMDTVMNYNSTPNSQVLPAGAGHVMPPEQLKRISDNLHRGNFLVAIGRKVPDASLQKAFYDSYKKDDDFRIEDVLLPFTGQTSKLPSLQRYAMEAFFRSDHRQFWDSEPSWPAVFLTDSADYRGFMTVCYHELCDDISHVTPEMITSLGKTADALVGAATLLTERMCEAKKAPSPSTGTRGFETLMKGGSAVDGIVSGITACELKPCANNPLNPNVGFGGKPNEVGETTLDALIMNGVGHQSGAVGCLRRVKNAIGVARAVMNYTKHSLLIGDDATNFAKEFGFPEESLTTNNSRKVWEDWKSNKCQPNFWKNLPGDPQSGCRPYSFPDTQRKRREVAEDNHDTIGMVAVDANGNVAAGCSTNGLGFKIPGRVGDSPIAGAGAYADNDVGAAAATGNGDIMAKYLPTYQTVEFMRQGFSPEKAAEMALMRIHKIYKDGFTGSVIAVNKKGEYGAASYKWTSFKYSVRNPALGKSVVGDKAPFDPARAAREPACGPTSGAVSSTVKIFCVGLFSIVVMSVL
ncbi:uncharacterized protein LOC5521891 isoform X2 [Nematostella vectensis]|uniref:uncharacterized protein LOC5521891 isoform X2 n=1 Tax=Nematostella vectensis TaxID=45351 RepID=UPI00138FCD07|nr:uncharacterized protein LOC5521891 isoform X2 [Nematostella vectensis]